MDSGFRRNEGMTLRGLVALLILDSRFRGNDGVDAGMTSGGR